MVLGLIVPLFPQRRGQIFLLGHRRQSITETEHGQEFPATNERIFSPACGSEMHDGGGIGGIFHTNESRRIELTTRKSVWVHRGPPRASWES